MPKANIFKPAIALLLLAAAAQPAAALTITPFFDSTIVGASNQATVEAAINQAISNIDSEYTNSGSIGIVFSQQNTSSFLGQSQTVDTFLSYAAYKTDLTRTSGRETANTLLATAVANLSKGNDANGASSVAVTYADAKLALGLAGFTGCFTTAGVFNSSCNQAAFGVITLTSNTGLGLNYGTSAVAGQFSMIATTEHEIDEILGGGGQGSMLNAVYNSTPTFDTSVGVLDLYRYSAANTPSFTTSSSASAYLSADGGVTSIVCMNQAPNGDYGDFCTNTNIQSAFSSSGNGSALSTPEISMMNIIGYASVSTPVPEPATTGLLLSAIAGLAAIRRRRQ